MIIEKKEIGKIIRRGRLKKDLTQDELGKLLSPHLKKIPEFFS